MIISKALEEDKHDRIIGPSTDRIFLPAIIQLEWKR